MTDDLRALAAELDALGQTLAPGRPETPPDPPDFRLGPLLGRGGMGAVYRAEQLSLGRPVAVKFIDRAGEGFAEEARALARLHHPGIVHVYAAGKDWFAMELVEGESADRADFPGLDDVARLGLAAAEALAYAHRCGILHRDIKPSNLFLGAEGPAAAKLGDFGLACLAADAPAAHGGTLRYMAPERRRGEPATEAADQFSLGATLRELAGERLQGDFAAIVAKATAEDPAARYPSVEALRDDLRRFLAREPVRAAPPSLLRRGRLFARRNPLAAVGLAAAHLCLFAFAAALAAGYVRTRRALDATRREAAQGAQALAHALAEVEKGDRDPRAAELARATKLAEALARRFPDDPAIAEAVQTLREAARRHAALPVRRRPAR